VTTSVILYLVEKFKETSGSGHGDLDGVVRSRL